MGIHKLIQHLLIFSIISLLLQQSISLTGYEPGILRSDKRVAELFQQWKEKHGKVYNDDEEMANRLENFKMSLKYVVERSSGRDGFMVGLNRFADLSNEEFKAKWFRKVVNPVRLSQSRHIRSGQVRTCDAPLSLDWRIKGVVSSVKDQHPHGSSWAFSSIAAIEGVTAINNGELASLSETQVLVDCDKTRNGYDGCHEHNAFEDDRPFTEVHFTSDPNKVAEGIVQFDGFEDVDESDSALVCATVNQPIRVGVHGSSIDFQLYTGGVYDGDCSSNPEDNDHAVLIVGYGSKDGKDYWIVKNSWGSGWGMDGYMYIRRNTHLQYGVCAINARASYPTQTSIAMSHFLAPSSPLSSSPPWPSIPPLSPPVSPPQLSPPLSPPATPPPSHPLPTPPPSPPSPPSPSPPPTPSPPPPSPPPYSPLLPSSTPPPPLSPPPPAPLPPPPLPPPPPYHPIPPSPPPPSPIHCGDYTYCGEGQTCCCLYKAFGYCMINGCCDYTEGVCCSGTDYCCPREYPICAVDEGICLKKSRDYLGISAMKTKLAKLKLPWSKHESKEMTYQPLQWRRAAVR